MALDCGGGSGVKATFIQTRVRVRVRVFVYGLSVTRTRFNRKSGASASLVQAAPMPQAHNSTRVCLLAISTEIESSECFAKKVTIFYYINNNCTNRAPLIMNNSTLT